MEYAGEIVDIDGHGVWVVRETSAGPVRYVPVPMTKVYLHDIIETGRHCVVTVDLAAGGIAQFGNGCHGRMLRSDIMVTRSTIDSLFDWLTKPKLAGQDKKFEIRTSGGVMGGMEG